MGRYSAIAAPFSRTGFRVLDESGRPVGVIVHDSRNLHGAACRLCRNAVYDRSSWTTTALWLARHLADGHVDLDTGELSDGVHGLVLDAGRLRRTRQVVRLAAQVTAAWRNTRERSAA